MSIFYNTREMKLSLSRPIIFFDIEATGLNVATDRIVELCYIKLYPDGTETVKIISIYGLTDRAIFQKKPLQ